MFEYSALFGSSLREQLHDSYSQFVQWAGDIHPLWYAAVVVTFFILVRLMTSKKIR